jgi:hypothetical protein
MSMDKVYSMHISPISNPSIKRENNKNLVNEDLKILGMMSFVALLRINISILYILHVV